MTGLGIAIRLLHLAARVQLVGAFVSPVWVARPAWQTKRGCPGAAIP